MVSTFPPAVQKSHNRHHSGTLRTHLAGAHDVVQRLQLLLEGDVIVALVGHVIGCSAEEGHVPVWPMDLQRQIEQPVASLGSASEFGREALHFL